MQYRFTQNLGSDDARECSQKCGCNIDHKECVADAVVSLPKAAAEWLTTKYPALLESPDSVKAVAMAPEITGVPEESPVFDESASQAIDEISRMKAKDKLQHIIDNDKRVTVVKAAKERLASL